jgi:CRISPR-associated endonuclease/helicase Cas3
MKPEFVAHTPRKGTEEWHDLKEHLECVAEMARERATKFHGGEIAHVAGLWHDLGKFNPDFQNYLEQCFQADRSNQTAPSKSVPHAIHGAIHAEERLNFLAPIIAGHHAGIPDFSELVSNKIKNPKDQETWKLSKPNAERIVGSLEAPDDIETHLDNLPNEPFAYELFLRFLFSTLTDADFLDTEKHFNPEGFAKRGNRIPLELYMLRLKRHQKVLTRKALTGSSLEADVNRVRAEVYEACLNAAMLEPGVFRLTVPTGGGKTLSGLAFALAHALHHQETHRFDRVIFAVPYTSIIDQNAKVYRKVFRNLGLNAVLEHHSAIKRETKAERDKLTSAETEALDKAHILGRLASQNWDAQLIVTTTVQLFESLFGNYPSKCRKLHNIARSVIVLDEVQALPIGLLTPIIDVLQELTKRYGVSVVLCTATQPALERQDRYFTGFKPGTIRDIVPPQTASDHFNRLKRVEYDLSNLEPIPWEVLAGRIAAEPERQVLAVLNTRKDALKLLAKLRPILAKRNETDSLFHLSTLLCGRHRQQVLEKITERLELGLPVHLISTQVVEAGVDLDFPAVYRALGPLERMVQAAGRCNRNGKLKRDGQPIRGRVVIFVPEDGGTPPGEYAAALVEAKRQLERGIDLNNPVIFDAYYARLYQAVQSDKYDIQSLRENLNFPKVSSESRLIRDENTPVVIPFDEEARELIKKIRARGLHFSDHRNLQPYLVNLRERDFKEWQGMTTEIAPEVYEWPKFRYNEITGIELSAWSVEDFMV